jgi:hypothetical protein
MENTYNKRLKSAIPVILGEFESMSSEQRENQINKQLSQWDKIKSGKSNKKKNSMKSSIEAIEEGLK